jgi:hypothetical protein
MYTSCLNNAAGPDAAAPAAPAANVGRTFSPAAR